MKRSPQLLVPQLLVPQLLVIDDEPQLLELLALTLHLAGFDVKSALSGPAGLEHARQTSFDLIVLGTLMVPWDGLETARLLPCCPPIIFLGGVPGEAGPHESRPYESRPHESRPEAAPRLPKPFRTSQLIALVEATLPPGLQPRS